MKANPQKRCSICRQWYEPDPRTKAHQRCCSRPNCKREFKSRANKSWQMRHPGYDTSRKLKKRGWAHQTGYWRHYRAEHAAYRRKEKQRMQEKRKHAKTVANQDATATIAVEQLAGIPRWEFQNAANQAVMDRRVDQVVECLIQLVGVANQDGIGIPRSPVP